MARNRIDVLILEACADQEAYKRLTDSSQRNAIHHAYYINGQKIDTNGLV